MKEGDKVKVKDNEVWMKQEGHIIRKAKCGYDWIVALGKNEIEIPFYKNELEKI